MTRPTFADVRNALSKAAVPIRELHGKGHVAVTLAAGRIVALAFDVDGQNLLWSNPGLVNYELVRNQPEKLVGGIGGERLWFAPELDFHWKGPPDWATVTNYEVPPATDPGSYSFCDVTEQEISLHNAGQLVSHRDGHRVGFSVTRTIRLTPSPIADDYLRNRQARFAGIETSHRLQFDPQTKAGRLALWHLLQVPVGSILIVPLRKDAKANARTPLSYALPGGWIQYPDKVLWRYDGIAHAKFGISASALTQRTAVLQRHGSHFILIVRQFRVDENAVYIDHPYGRPRSDQAFQAWDGMGFGEVEHHSRCIDAHSGPYTLNETDQLWAFGGTKRVILDIANRLLHTDIGDAIDLLRHSP